MKQMILSSLMLVALFAVSCNAKNTTWGIVGQYDHIDFREIVVKSSKILRIVTKDVDYPPKGNIGKTITAIRVTDQYQNGNGGYASLLSGGVGYNHTRIHLKSQRGHGLSFIVEIFSKW